MPVETPHHPPPRPAEAASLREYVASLRSADEVTELILRLEQGPAGDPGLEALARATGLDWAVANDVKTAILALGTRARELSGRPDPEIAAIGARDLAGLSRVLLARAEATRVADAAADADALRKTVEGTLALHRRNAPPRTEEDRRWEAGVEEAVRDRFVPAYVAAARRANRLEDHPIGGLLLRSRFATALLVASLGVLSLPLPLSTPLICLALGLLGAYIVHPAYVRQLAEPLRSAAENLAAEEGRIARLASPAQWKAEDLRLDTVVANLLPILENKRAAGVTDEKALRAVAGAYLDTIAPRVAETGRTDEYFQLVRRFCEGRLVRDWSRYATARRQWEGTFLVHVLDTPWASALAFGVVTLPLSAVSAVVSPFPEGIDFPLMILLFTVVGGFLPRLLPGTLPARAAMLGEIASHQAEIEKLG
jgi:hypothetical protein